jgi:hypothetical protein
MTTIKNNPKVSIKEYMATFCCSEKTAIKYRQTDKDVLGISKKSPLRYEHFKQLYGYYPLS